MSFFLIVGLNLVFCAKGHLYNTQVFQHWNSLSYLNDGSKGAMNGNVLHAKVGKH